MLNIINLLGKFKLSTSHPLELFKLDIQLEPSYTAGRNVKWYSHFGKRFGIFLKSYKFTLQPSNSTSRYVRKRNENRCLHKDSYMNVHSSIIHNNQKLEIAKCASTGEWINKMLYVHAMEYTLIHSIKRAKY